MEFFIYLAPIFGGLILYAIIDAVVKAPGRLLNQKFVSLGDMRGMSYADIEKVVGKPQSVSQMGDGGTLRQWISTGYHIALVFDENDKMVGISHETSV